MQDAIQRKRAERDALMDKETRLTETMGRSPQGREEIKRVRAALAEVLRELAELERQPNA